MGTEASARFGPFELDAGVRRLLRDGKPLHLTPKAFDLLVVLVRAAPRVVDKTSLHERLWPGVFVSDATLNGLVKELRRALDDSDRSAPVIRTVTRIGYALALQVTCLGSTNERATATRHWLVAGDKRFRLHVGANEIGRDPESDVCIESPSVSRRHARLHIDGDVAHIEDLHSKNGTRVGDQPVADAHPLRDRDRLTIGAIVMMYRTSAAVLTTETCVDEGGVHRAPDMPRRGSAVLGE